MYQCRRSIFPINKCILLYRNWTSAKLKNAIFQKTLYQPYAAVFKQFSRVFSTYKDTRPTLIKRTPWNRGEETLIIYTDPVAMHRCTHSGCTFTPISFASLRCHNPETASFIISRVVIPMRRNVISLTNWETFRLTQLVAM